MKAIVGMLSVLVSTIYLSAHGQGSALVEVVLAARLDEPRGYCLDVVGHQNKATPTRGLQTHSCYSYQGRLGVDQRSTPIGFRQGNSICRGSRCA